MPTPPGNAPLTSSMPPADQIAHLAVLYDAFANALDPFLAERDQAERVFNQEVSNWFDQTAEPRPKFQEFRKAVILRCRLHLKAERRPPAL